MKTCDREAIGSLVVLVASSMLLSCGPTPLAPGFGGSNTPCVGSLRECFPNVIMYQATVRIGAEFSANMVSAPGWQDGFAVEGVLPATGNDWNRNNATFVTQSGNCFVGTQRGLTIFSDAEEIQVEGPRGFYSRIGENGPTFLLPGESARFKLIAVRGYSPVTAEVTLAPSARWLAPTRNVPPDGSIWRIDRHLQQPLTIEWTPVSSGAFVVELEQSIGTVRAKCYFDGRLGTGVIPADVLDRMPSRYPNWRLITAGTVANEQIVNSNGTSIVVYALNFSFFGTIRDIL